jgi:hypothetical protein
MYSILIVLFLGWLIEGLGVDGTVGGLGNCGEAIKGCGHACSQMIGPVGDTRTALDDPDRQW